MRNRFSKRAAALIVLACCGLSSGGCEIAIAIYDKAGNLNQLPPGPDPAGGTSTGGVGSGGAGGGGQGSSSPSDIRLKHDVVRLGTLENGLGFYRFAYNGQDKSYVGVMAQEVEQVDAAAVSRGPDGYLRVYYDRLGFPMQTHDEWAAAGGKIPAVRSRP